MDTPPLTKSPTTARLADVLGALSIATDLAAGVPMETSLRTCVVGMLVGAALGLDPVALADVYYTVLLRHLGCTAFSHEASVFGAGDDHDLLRTFETVDPDRPLEVAARAVRDLASHATLGARLAAVTRTLTSPSASSQLASAQCDQAVALAEDLAMRPAVVRALGQIYERFDGRGTPHRLRGEGIEIAGRVLHLANLVEVQHRHGGRQRAEEEVRRRRGGQLDPALADAYLANAASFSPALEAAGVWDAYLDAEPGEPRILPPAALDGVALAFGRYADLKTPATLGHSSAVAALVEVAGRSAGMAALEIEAARRAALLHDLGAVCVPNGIWEKAGALNDAEWERVRLHAYYTERILARVPALAPAAAIAGAHHERGDGNGYPRGAAVAGAAGLASQLLACADSYQALTAVRPHRAAFSAEEAARILRDEAHAGRLSLRAVDCVLAAAGHAPPPSAAAPRGLSAREVETLVHLARGLTNKEIASALGISPRTVQHHVEHIYAKTGVSTRAAAALFAVRNDLVVAK